MRQFVLGAIRVYQRYVSPYKGFCCAYRTHTGRSSCSQLGFRAVRRYGVFTGLGLINQRVRLCGVVHRRHRAIGVRAPQVQRGACDVGCDVPCDLNCDLPGDCNAHKGCNGFSACDCCNCDWPRRDKRSTEQEKYVYIPPKVSRPTKRTPQALGGA